MQKTDNDPGQGVCKRCRGTGRISVIRIELPIESGVFCDHCDTGRQRWKAVSKLIDEIETDRLTTVFVPKGKSEPTSGPAR
jgi:hypothetical protein